MKTDTPLIRTPASVSVVTHQQIVDQNAQSVAQALRYTPGIVAEQRGINTDSLEYLYSRGFQAETYLDGLRMPAPGQAGFNIMSRDIYLIDRIESIRGPASVLYGQTPPGGLFNIVSKQPLETPYHELFFQSGSYGRVQGGFDFSGPLDNEKTLLYRVTGVGLDTGTQTDFVRQERYAIAPSFTWKIDPDTKLTVRASYQDDPQAGIYNFVPAYGTVLPSSVHIPRSMNLGDPGFDSFRKQEASVGYTFEHRFNDVWEFKQNARYLYNDIDIQQAGPSGNFPQDSTVLQRTPYINTGTLNSGMIDNQAIAKFDTGFLSHKALFGTDYQYTQYNHYIFNGYTAASGLSAPPLNLLNPIYYQNIPKPNNMLGSSTAVAMEQTGLYAEDQISFGKWTFVGGLRQDWTSMNVRSYVNGQRQTQDPTALTGRGAVMYNFDSGFAPYFSYSTSFQPVAGINSTTGAAFKPTEGEQYEVGLKYQPPGTKSLFTVAAFDLRQTNVAAVLPGNVTYQIGEVRSRGLEFEARTNLTDRLQAVAAYTYNEAENTVASPTTVGKSPVGIPLNMASLWLSYDMPTNIAPGMKLSGGVRYIDSTWGDNINSFRVPGFALVDLGLQYDLGQQFAALKGYTVNASVSNLFDKDYIAGCQGASPSAAICEYGAGRMVLAGVRYRW